MKDDSGPGADHTHEDDHSHDHDDAARARAGYAKPDLSRDALRTLELLKIAAQVTGYAGAQGVMKPGDSRRALKDIWEVFSEFYAWIDPEEAEDDDEDDEEDDE